MAGTLYAGPAISIVHALKYSAWHHLADVCAGRMVSALGPLRASWLLPVPMHVVRRRERGGRNHARTLAEALARRTGGIVVGGLSRTRATDPQVDLGRAAREANVRDAFEYDGTAPRGTLLLVDDVATSGATGMAAARVVLRAGADQVVLVTFALAPDSAGA